MLDLDINSALLDVRMLLLAMEFDEERLLEEVLRRRGSIFPSHCVYVYIMDVIICVRPEGEDDV